MFITYFGPGLWQGHELWANYGWSEYFQGDFLLNGQIVWFDEETSNPKRPCNICRFSLAQVADVARSFAGRGGWGEGGLKMAAVCDRRLQQQMPIDRLPANGSSPTDKRDARWVSSGCPYYNPKTQAEVRSVTSELYQLLLSYSAFKGLLITAVGQSSLLQCHNVGFPLALSALAMAGVAIGMAQKNMLIWHLKRMKLVEDPVWELGYPYIDCLVDMITDP